MASLYTIDARLFEVIEHGMSLDEETGEVWFDGEQFDQLADEHNAKLEACALYVKNLDADAAAIKAEEKALADRRRAAERKAERMRDYIARSMDLFGDDRLETARAALAFRKSSAVEVTDEAALAPRFITTKTTTAPDKAAIKAAIKAGEVVQGAAIVERKTLQVK